MIGVVAVALAVAVVVVGTRSRGGSRQLAATVVSNAV